jgi:hypothetical protein
LTEPRYTIRLRYAGHRGRVAFIIESATGEAYIYSGEGLVCRLSSGFRLVNYVSTLHRLGWIPVPTVAPYSLNALGRLIGLIAA